MKVLFITILLPYPIDSGAKYKTHHILKLISAKNNIDFVSMIDDEHDLVNAEPLKKYCRTYKVFFSPIVNARHNQLLFKLALSVFLTKPFIVFKYYSHEMKNYIEELCRNRKYDLIYIDHLNMAQYIPVGYVGKLIYDEADISSLAFTSFSIYENNPLLKFIYILESSKLKRFERKYLKKFHHIFTISELDRKRIIKVGNLHEKKITHLPVPFKTLNLYSYRERDPLISFIGLLSWKPNLKGIIWFIDKVYPHIKRSIPSVRMKIAGKMGNRLMKHLNNIADMSISYEGYLVNLDSLYKKTSVFINPIHEGGGVRIKLLHALSRGMPVVSTSKGAEGVPVTSSKEVVIADDPLSFAEAVIEIIKNKETGRHLSEQGLALMEKHYNHDLTDKILKSVIYRGSDK
ncbi:MAG: group 1 glycosyl transferase [Candidatus Gottesmanbacteria bacterium GW2011_GWA2_43_14]|uniref:Group 1 glycosyl transferase n=1 Tax=Candidatus Gottesmanbacteria bacterium GW2011_GWA2_43_14 TaxID=1618443 RepID=A0A0G1DL88_9BACT|nr:MAG: group 1 glycosyl transferase [Candidatus Gottesmanbacteria bacterium GW2011_GWA2_43_14]